MGSPLVRAAFAALVGATIAVFFVTQQLKGEFPLVLRFAVAPKAISPNGDGVRDGAIVGFDLSEPATVSFSVVDSEGSDVRRLVDDRRLAGDTKHRFFWNGRDDAGRRVPDGIYRLRLVRRDEGRVINSFKELRVDTRPPRVELSSARPGVIAPGDPGRHPRVAIRYRGLRNGAPEFRIFRTDDGSPRVVARFRGNDKRMGLWRGHIRGHPAVDGDYAFTVTIRDGAGNRGVAPAEIPTAELALPGTGVSVRHLTLLGPVGVLRAGSPAVLEVGPYPRGFEFALSRLGSKRIVKRGSRFGGRFRVRVPPRARTGVYLLRVRARRRRAVWPLAVEGRPQARGPRPLVVLPVVSWEGLNRFDDDLDGFAETLQDSRSVRLERPFARGRPPPLYDSQATPLLRFLDREKLPFDLTTDVSLDRGEHPSLARAPGRTPGERPRRAHQAAESEPGTAGGGAGPHRAFRRAFRGGVLDIRALDGTPPRGQAAGSCRARPRPAGLRGLPARQGTRSPCGHTAVVCGAPRRRGSRGDQAHLVAASARLSGGTLCHPSAA